VPQAEGLERVLTELGRSLNAVVVFDIDDDEIVQRISGRLVCDKTQQPYAGFEPGTRCPDCEGTLVRRKDDEPAAVRTRLDVYRAQTLPVLDWYQAQGANVRIIDAVGAVEDVTDRALAAVGLPTGGPGRPA
jgi:adenylate kinase